MKKPVIIMFVLCLVTTAFAVVQITLNVPTPAVALVLDAFNTLAGKEIEITGHEDDFSGRWTYRYSPKDPNETQKQFAERVVKESVKAMVRLVEDTKENARYQLDVEAVPSPDIDVPDEIIE